MVTVQGNVAEFRFFRPSARAVHLIGDFNGWNETQIPMASMGDGYWIASLRLPAGEFKFRYSADGEWFTDYAAFGVETGAFGMDSIVRVAGMDAVAVVPSGQRAVAVVGRGWKRPVSRCA